MGHHPLNPSEAGLPMVNNGEPLNGRRTMQAGQCKLPLISETGDINELRSGPRSNSLQINSWGLHAYFISGLKQRKSPNSLPSEQEIPWVHLASTAGTLDRLRSPRCMVHTYDPTGYAHGIHSNALLPFRYAHDPKIRIAVPNGLCAHLAPIPHSTDEAV
jgi:hypothetical protein